MNDTVTGEVIKTKNTTHSASTRETQIMMAIPAKKAMMYPIRVGVNLLNSPERWLPNDWAQKKLVIITDDTVGHLYGNHLLNQLKNANPLLLTFPTGEQSKNAEVKSKIEEKMIQANCDRDTLLIALGGGVVGDLAGFIAATYMRGISYIQIPTTLLAMVDSSVGGKTSINTPQGKNLIGAFWQPRAVVADIHCLKTLPEVHSVNGLIEAVKMFLTNDAGYFHYVNVHLDHFFHKDGIVLQKIIERAIQIKVDVVSQDETEKNLRMILNFGHTIGHALEKITGYTIFHGFAVALGIWVEAKISELLGFLSSEDYHAIESLFIKLNISKQPLREISGEAIIEATKVDKKIRDNQIRYVLLKKIGQVYHEQGVFAHPVPDNIIKKAWSEIQGVQDGRQ